MVIYLSKKQEKREQNGGKFVIVATNKKQNLQGGIIKLLFINKKTCTTVLIPCKRGNKQICVCMHVYACMYACMYECMYV